MENIIQQIFFSIVSFLRDEWLWSMTWGWYQISLGLLFTWILLMYHSRMKSLPALILTVTSYWSAFVIYTLFIIVGLSQLIKTEHMPVQVVNNLTISLGLAFIFTLIQAFFFKIINRWYRLKLTRVIWVTLLGNIFAALTATYFMRFALITVG